MVLFLVGGGGIVSELCCCVFIDEKNGNVTRGLEDFPDWLWAVYCGTKSFISD
jgi:hypothetical protein